MSAMTAIRGSAVRTSVDSLRSSRIHAAGFAMLGHDYITLHEHSVCGHVSRPGGKPQVFRVFWRGEFCQSDSVTRAVSGLVRRREV